MQEFKNKTFQTFLKKHGIRHFVTYNETKAQIVERFNRTLKQLMWRMFTTSSSYHYLSNLDGLVNDNYNHSVHRSIQMKPVDVTVFNAQDVWRTFTIAQRLSRNPPAYRLREGTFYEAELQRVIEKSDHLFCIDKILQSRGRGSQKEVLVHWKGWPKSYDSWLQASQLVSLQQS